MEDFGYVRILIKGLLREPSKYFGAFDFLNERERPGGHPEIKSVAEASLFLYAMGLMEPEKPSQGFYLDKGRESYRLLNMIAETFEEEHVSHYLQEIDYFKAAGEMLNAYLMALRAESVD